MTVASNPRKFYWINILNNVNFLAPITTLFYLHRGMDLSQIFSFMVIIVATMLVGEVPTGIISDKFGRKTSIVIGQITFLASSILLYFAHSYAAFVIVFFLAGLAFTFFSGSDESMIFDSLKQIGDESGMKKAMGSVWSGAVLPSIIIAPIGSYIAQDLTSQQFAILLIANILVNFFSLLVVFTLKEPERQTEEEENNPLVLFKIAFEHVKKSPQLMKLFVNKTLVLIVGAWVISQIWQPYLKMKGVDVIYFGWIVAAISLIVYLLYQNLERIEKSISDKKLLLITALIPLFCFMIGPFVEIPLVAVLVYFAIAVSVNLRNPVFSHYFNMHIESKNRATVLSSLSVVDSAFDVVIILSAGFIADLSIYYTFFFSAAVILLAMSLFPIRETYLTPS